MPKQKYKVIWSKGPMDDPTEGEFEVEATNLGEAWEKVAFKLDDPDMIDGIIRSDIWKSLT